MITYHIDARDTASHVYHVRLVVTKPSAVQRVSLPVWIPGSYLVREFSRHLHGLQAHQGTTALAVQAIDKCTWDVACQGSSTLTLRYSVYALDPSVRAAFLDVQRGFFNGTSLCLRVHERDTEPHQLRLTQLPKGWEVATAMPAEKVDAQGLGSYLATDYTALIDHPVVMGSLWRGKFTAHGVAHELVVSGTLPEFDTGRLLSDCRKICEAEIAFWHDNKQPPFEKYVFLLHTRSNGYGGLEHSASTALICSRTDLPQPGKTEVSDNYQQLLGLISHEYFHAWNVKRLRPTDFRVTHWHQENYTELLWFFEGFTSYYDDLFLVRCGLINEARYTKTLSKVLRDMLSCPGRHVQSLAQASFEAWIKYYRSDENSPNTSVSYYKKGSLVAWALDMGLRSSTKGSLDDVMRLLWSRGADSGITQADILQAVREVGGESWATQLHRWVQGVEDPPWAALLAAFGMAWQAVPPTLAERWGLKVTEHALTGVTIAQVLNGGMGERIGLCPGDEVLGLNHWRVRRLEDIVTWLANGKSATLLVVRDEVLVTLKVPAGACSASAPGSTELAPQGVLVLQPQAQASQAAAVLRKAWLGT